MFVCASNNIFSKVSSLLNLIYKVIAELAFEKFCEFMQKRGHSHLSMLLMKFLKRHLTTKITI